MSSSSGFSGQKPAASSEKPSFTRTCSLLSQYLKENGSFGDLSLGMTCTAEANSNGSFAATTMNLFPDKPADVPESAPWSLKSMDLFPQQAGAGFSSPKEEDGLKIADSRDAKVEQPKAAQMTIFYAGQVIVFNDFPADKAKEIMQLAGQGISPMGKTTPFESSIGITPTTKAISSFGNNVKQDSVKPAPSRPIVCDLPIARRASLHRFLEKRKDRITTKAPYQVTGPPSSKPVDFSSKSWLSHAAQ